MESKLTAETVRSKKLRDQLREQKKEYQQIIEAQKQKTEQLQQQLTTEKEQQIQIKKMVKQQNTSHKNDMRAIIWFLFFVLLFELGCLFTFFSCDV